MKKWNVLVAVVAIAMIGCGEGSSSLTELSADNGQLENPRFSPDGERLVALYSGDDVEDHALMVMDADGANREVILEDVSYLTAPFWSPDGMTIYYNDRGISRLDPDGENHEELFSVFGVPTSPGLSPDGDVVVYGSNGGNLQIKALDTDDSPTDLGESGNSPRFSPDGSRIAFARATGLFVMNADGTSIEEVVDGEFSYLSSLNWLPDGEQVAVTTHRGIELIEIDTGTRTVIHDQFAAKDLDVSPDGQRIIFAINGQTHLTVLEDF